MSGLWEQKVHRLLQSPQAEAQLVGLLLATRGSGTIEVPQTLLQHCTKSEDPSVLRLVAAHANESLRPVLWEKHQKRRRNGTPIDYVDVDLVRMTRDGPLLARALMESVDLTAVAPIDPKDESPEALTKQTIDSILGTSHSDLLTAYRDEILGILKTLPSKSWIASLLAWWLQPSTPRELRPSVALVLLECMEDPPYRRYGAKFWMSLVQDDTLRYPAWSTLTRLGSLWLLEASTHDMGSWQHACPLLRLASGELSIQLGMLLTEPANAKAQQLSEVCAEVVLSFAVLAGDQADSDDWTSDAIVHVQHSLRMALDACSESLVLSSAVEDSIVRLWVELTVSFDDPNSGVALRKVLDVDSDMSRAALIPYILAKCYTERPESWEENGITDEILCSFFTAFFNGNPDLDQITNACGCIETAQFRDVEALLDAMLRWLERQVQKETLPRPDALSAVVACYATLRPLDEHSPSVLQHAWSRISTHAGQEPSPVPI